MKLHGTQTDECRDGARGLETEEIAGFSNIEKEPQRCKEAKLHDAQTLHPIENHECTGLEEDKIA